MNMNPFRREEKQTDAPHEPTFDHDLAEHLRNSPPLRRSANEFAPRGRQVAITQTVEQIDTFFALPLKDIDEEFAKHTVAYEEAKARHQEIRDLIMRIRGDELARMNRERRALEIHNEAVSTMTERIRALYRPAVVEEPQRQEPPSDLDAQQDDEHEQQGAA